MKQILNVYLLFNNNKLFESILWYTEGKCYFTTKYVKLDYLLDTWCEGKYSFDVG